LELHLRPSLIGFLLRRRRWLLGTALGILGWPLQALALAFAPLALVQRSSRSPWSACSRPGIACSANPSAVAA